MDNYKEVEVLGALFRCYSFGRVERKIRGCWKRCDSNKPDLRRRDGGIYVALRVLCKTEMCPLSRIVYYAFNPTFDFHDPEWTVVHVNMNSLDLKIDNLRAELKMKK